MNCPTPMGVTYKWHEHDIHTINNPTNETLNEVTEILNKYGVTTIGSIYEAMYDPALVGKKKASIFLTGLLMKVHHHPTRLPMTGSVL